MATKKTTVLTFFLIGTAFGVLLSNLADSYFKPTKSTKLQIPEVARVIKPHDVLEVFVDNVIGHQVAPDYIANDSFACTFGFPIPVRSDGTLSLPIIGNLHVSGMTLTEAESAIGSQYLQLEELKASPLPVVLKVCRRFKQVTR